MAGTILIIEDNYVMLKIWQTELERAGFNVMVSNNSRLGMAKAKEKNPSLIIIDSVLPDMDGYEVCQRLKTDLKTSSIPVLLSFQDYKSGFSCLLITMRISVIEISDKKFLKTPF